MENYVDNECQKDAMGFFFYFISGETTLQNISTP